MGPGPLGPHTFSTYNKCYWGKHYFHKMLQGSEYNRMLNMSVFWRYQGPEYASGSEYTRVLNKLGFWISQGSEYAKVLKMPLVLNMPLILNFPGFWICQGYTGFWICLNISDWIYLDLSEYAAICANMAKSAWMAFVLYFPIIIPSLLERVVTFFNVYTKLGVCRKMRLFSWRHPIWFNNCMYFIWFLF